MMKFTNWVLLRESDNEEAAFIQAIHDNPYDNTTWLVYADWLQDRGDPRAEVIRKAKSKLAKPPKREVEYQTYPAWRRAIQTLYPGVTIEGDKDIANAAFHGVGVGEWDGATGQIYNRT